MATAAAGIAFHRRHTHTYVCTYMYYGKCHYYVFIHFCSMYIGTAVHRQQLRTHDCGCHTQHMADIPACRLCRGMSGCRSPAASRRGIGVVARHGHVVEHHAFIAIAAGQRRHTTAAHCSAASHLRVPSRCPNRPAEPRRRPFNACAAAAAML